MLITLELVKDTWKACSDYSKQRLISLYNRPHTALEVLTRVDGEWESVPAKDRLWTVFHEGVLTDSQFRLFSCSCAKLALEAERNAGREPDERSWKAIEVAERFAVGNATEEELKAAQQEAGSASRSVWSAIKPAWPTADSTARSAGWSSWSAAWLASESAVWSAWSAGWSSTAYSAACSVKLEILVKIIQNN